MAAADDLVACRCSDARGAWTYNPSTLNIESGTRLGPYEIVKPIDSGGMGEVFRARDTRLGRSVALKVIKDGFSDDPKRRARFEREAKVVSSLAHPNICQLYDLGTANGIDYLVMELVEGQTLAQRLENGPLPLPQALQIGAEIAAALAAAHREQVVHRDVKPSNVILGRSGAKLVDFGLAKDNVQGDSSRDRTVTDDGAAPGTLPYMSPEQISGERGDARSDLWSLGAVLYEMATGRPAFDGATRAEVMSRILGGPPDLDDVEHTAVRQIIAGCLTLDPDERWQSAQDIARQLRAIEPKSEPLRRQNRRRALLLAGGILMALAAVLGLWYWRRPAAQPEPRLSVALPPGSTPSVATPCVAISSDGRRVAFIVLRNEMWELYSRSLDDFRPTLLTQGPPLASVTFSPDGEWLAFGRGSKILKIRASGGPEQVVADLPGTTSRGISWGSDGSIYFSALAGGIFRSPADGSPPHQITRPDSALDENSHRWPHALPDGKHLLFNIRTGKMTSFDEARIALLSLETGKSKVLLDGGTNPRYVRSGHLLFAQGNSVLAAPFDLERGVVSGEPVPVLRGIASAPFSGAAHFDVAQTEGTLIYAAGGTPEAQSNFRVVDRKGLVVGNLNIPRAVDSFRVSPDGKRVAVQVSAANDDIWIWDRSRDALTRLSSLSGDETGPTWSPDGRMIYYSSSTGLYRQPVDQSAPERIVEGSVLSFAAASPRDGLVAYVKVDRTTRTDIWIIDLDGDRQPRIFAGTPHEEYLPQFSPDGQWLSYASNETGVMELYLGNVSSSRRVQVTSGGVMEYRWSPDGHEMFYRVREDFFAVPIGAGDPPEIGRPELMFRLPAVWYFDVLGEHFLMGSRPWRGPQSAGLDVIPRWGRKIPRLVARGDR